MSMEPAFLMELRDGASVATVQLSDLSAKIIESLQAQMESATSGQDKPLLVMDLSKVKFIDSVALGALVVLLRRIKKRDGRLALVGLSGHCLNVMRVTGMNRVFDLHEDLSSALSAMKRSQ